ncbi:5534_t:CDS:1, partial [Paraglomus occultum]
KSEDDSEKWSKSVIKLTKAQKTLLQEFKESFEGRKKESHSFNQGSCTAEIRNVSGHTCHLNQSAVSKMLK